MGTICKKRVVDQGSEGRGKLYCECIIIGFRAAAYASAGFVLDVGCGGEMGDDAIEAIRPCRGFGIVEGWQIL